MIQNRIIQIEKLFEDVLKGREGPVFKIPQKGKTDRRISLLSVKTSKSFAIYCKVLIRMYSMLKNKTYCTKRDIFYEAPELYLHQFTVDKAIKDISLLLKQPAVLLGVRASPKGLIYGNIQISMADGSGIDCIGSHNTLIPEIEDVVSIRIHPNTVFLIIEKEATFRAFIQSNINLPNENLVFVTGKGYPCTSTRRFLNFIEKVFSPKMYIVVDFDPHGYQIALHYKIGGIECESDEESQTIKNAIVLGIKYKDLKDNPKLAEGGLELTQRERKMLEKMIKNLSEREGFDSIISELLAMKNLNRKAEIQAICDENTGNIPNDFIKSRI
eukprot:GHVP01013713.1.p1 GENE.GHVP01013713.1~~GHVP01013713.1.p1  ORF type:complete len:328 (-),score=60.87 GHVP01013713.1:336-1319(-)